MQKNPSLETQEGITSGNHLNLASIKWHNGNVQIHLSDSTLLQEVKTVYIL